MLNQMKGQKLKSQPSNTKKKQKHLKKDLN